MMFCEAAEWSASSNARRSEDCRMAAGAPGSVDSATGDQAVSQEWLCIPEGADDSRGRIDCCQHCRRVRLPNPERAGSVLGYQPQILNGARGMAVTRAGLQGLQL